MTSPYSPKPYSFNWARGILREFHETYARATDLLQKKLNLEDREIIHILRFNQKKWENFKKCVKILNNWIISVNWNNLETDKPFWTKYLTYVYEHEYLIVPNIEDYLHKTLDIITERVEN